MESHVVSQEILSNSAILRAIPSVWTVRQFIRMCVPPPPSQKRNIPLSDFLLNSISYLTYLIIHVSTQPLPPSSKKNK